MSSPKQKDSSPKQEYSSAITGYVPTENLNLVQKEMSHWILHS